MPGFKFRAGEDLTIWVRDRSNLPAFFAVTSLQKSLSQIGVSCSMRGLGSLPEHSIFLTRGEHPPEMAPFEEGDSDAFRIAVDSTGGVGLSSLGKRGLTYSIWSLLEEMGWTWPTPSLERSPKAGVFELEQGVRVHLPALRHRIVFLEEVQVTPEVIVWFSRLRLNTLFPANPARFSEPETQFSEACLARSQDLGFDWIIGGEWWDWLAGDLPENWTEDPSEIADRVLELWREMGEPTPRLSLWKDESHPELHHRIIEVLESRGDLHFERRLPDRLSAHPADPRILERLTREDPLAGQGSIKTLIEEFHDRVGGAQPDRSVYLASNRFGEDRRLGHSVSPFLWPSHLREIRAAIRAGLSGASIEFRGLPLERFLEGSGFAPALLARGMWEGVDWDETTAATQAYLDQFDTAGAVAARLVEDFSSWWSKMRNTGPDDPGTRTLHDVDAKTLLVSEKRRDRLDERISEIEESPPSEPCLELIRSLSTLVSLYDLETTADVHEAAATARTIWGRNGMDDWPDWLLRESPLAEQLRPLLRTTPTADADPSTR